MRKLIHLALFLAFAAVAPGRSQELENSRRDSVPQTVDATGTVEPEEIVEVGAQVAGKVVRFGTDPRDKKRRIDYGSPVEEGMVLAQLDDTLYRVQVHQAMAKLRLTQADLKLAQAQLRLAERALKRGRKPAIGAAAADLEAILGQYEVAKARVDVASAAVEGAEADLKLAQVNLDYTTIRSPVAGVIVDRRVNVGQTVVASLSAPSLFLIARDLKRMQVWVSVQEGDIGRVRVGQRATFKVAALPDAEFKGKVSRIRLNASVAQNVVTYTVVVDTDNSSGKLLPYMTAEVRIFVGEKKDGAAPGSKGNGKKPKGVRVDFGPDILLVQPGPPVRGGVNFGKVINSLTANDVEAIRRDCRAVADAAPVVRLRTPLVHGQRRWVPLYIYGTTPAYLSVRSYDLAQGQAFTDKDVRAGKRVCVVGETIVKEVFQGKSPLGKEIRIGEASFKVLGVLRRMGANQMGLDRDDIVLAPWTVIHDQRLPAELRPLYPLPGITPQLKGFTLVDMILVRAASVDRVDEATKEITALLRRRHRITADATDDFMIRDSRALNPFRRGSR
jgi:RND family efflux transporter MFP subunit